MHGQMQESMQSATPQLSPEETALLDAAMTPQVAQILLKLAPELQALLGKYVGGGQMPMAKPAMPATAGAIGDIFPGG